MKKFLLIITLALFGLSNIANAQYTKLVDFAGVANGSMPWGSLISDGTFLYGMTKNGGTSTNCTSGCGVIFKVMPDGTGFSKLHDFSSNTDGSTPSYGSLISVGGALYGMTATGGTGGDGTIFKIMPDGTGYAKLLDFGGSGMGSKPNGSLISDGTFLYGMTNQGGLNNMGTLFKIMPDGTGSVNLFDFGYLNGSYPFGSLISDGTFLYGMTNQGGTAGLGTLFKIMPDGTGFSKLLDFTNSGNGIIKPYGSLISDGTFLYGMTYQGGTSNMGSIFKIMPDGTGYAKLLNFTGTANGRDPYGSLITDGTFLYGMTYQGGTSSQGTLFKIKPDGTGFSKLVDFAGAVNGNNPYGSLVSDGAFLYGMTAGGGTNGLGTVFKYGITTGIAENKTETDFIVSPNPSTGKFLIELSGKHQQMSVEIYNIMGKKVLEQQKTNEIDLSNSPKGIYFVKINDGDNSATKKIIVE